MNHEEIGTVTHDKGRASGTGLYVDIENFESIGKELVTMLMQDWPEKAPMPTRLALYVRADSAELWNAWAT